MCERARGGARRYQLQQLACLVEARQSSGPAFQAYHEAWKKSGCYIRVGRAEGRKVAKQCHGAFGRGCKPVHGPPRPRHVKLQDQLHGQQTAIAPLMRCQQL